MMKLNGDVGESFGQWSMGCDSELIPLLDMANIACGFHASDPDHMSQTVKLCKAHSVTIGAHPGYPDLQGFGRRSLAMASESITHSILYQVGALQAVTKHHQTCVEYIKPHGALYNDMMASASVFDAVLQAAHTLQLPLMILDTAEANTYRSLADEQGVALIMEAFADRRYLSSGRLAPRQLDNAVLHQPGEILSQADAFLSQRPITTIEGDSLLLAPDTLCVHGDNQASIKVARQLKQRIAQTEAKARS